MHGAAITPEDVHEFWFGGDVRDAVAMQARMDVLFAVDAAFDHSVRVRFGAAVDAALGGAFEAWRGSPAGTLALLVLLDQMPRNVYRGEARAFAGDRRALAIALAAIAQGEDATLAPLERLFFYLPLEHAEDLALQNRCVAGYEAIHATAPPAFRALTTAAIEAGRAHREVIARFGRFPHRNALLGRPSSDAEREWLTTNRGGWGQGAADLERLGR